MPLRFYKAKFFGVEIKERIVENQIKRSLSDINATR